MSVHHVHCPNCGAGLTVDVEVACKQLTCRPWGKPQRFLAIPRRGPSGHSAASQLSPMVRPAPWLWFDKLGWTWVACILRSALVIGYGWWMVHYSTDPLLADCERKVWPNPVVMLSGLACLCVLFTIFRFAANAVSRALAVSWQMVGKHFVMGLVGLAVAPSLAAAVEFLSPPIVNPANGHSYRLLSANSWTNAELRAIQAGGHLASITSPAEDAWVYSTFANYGGRGRELWIGLSDYADGTFQWANGDLVTYVNWAPNQPDNDHGREYYGHIFGPSMYPWPGKWNDWYLGPAFGVVEFNPRQRASTFWVASDESWKVLAPNGNQEGSPLSLVGELFEFLNPGWNNEVAFDDSSWGAPAILSDTQIWAPQSATPAYFRKTFHLHSVPPRAYFLGGADDDAQVYVNGQRIVDDRNTTVSEFGPIDVSPWLVAGENLIAIKAHDSFGVVESIYAMIYGGPALLGDANYDNLIGAADYALWAAQFGKSGLGLSADFDGNGTVGAGDYAIWAAAASTATSVPEPATLEMCLTGLVLIGVVTANTFLRGKPMVEVLRTPERTR